MGLLSASLIGQFEGYRDNPYWDVNAYRAGFGSDTTTLADGSIIPIRQGMTVTREDSLRDLNRRIGSEFRPSVVSAIGQDAYGRLSEPQRAVLDSLAYNYGAGAWSKGLRGVASAVRTPGIDDDVQAIRALSSHNDGINAKRRSKEAEIYGGGGVGGMVNSFLPSGNGGENMQPGLLGAMTQQEDTRTIGERFADASRDGSLWDGIAVGLNSMRGRFADQGIAASAGMRMRERQQQRQVNQTAEWLRQNGREDLAAALEGGMIDGAQAFGMMQPEAPQYEVINDQLVQIGANGPQVVGDYRTPETADMSAPETQVFYDEETGQEYRAQWNPQTQQWQQIGGVKAEAGPLVENNVSTGGGKFEEAFAKGDADRIAEIDAAGSQAARNLGRIDRLESLIAQAPSGAEAGIKQWAGEFGIETEGLSELQAAQAMINSMVPEQRQPGSGPMSDADLALFKQSLPRLINSKDGNALIVHTLRGIAQYDAEGSAIIQELRLGNIDRSEAFRRLQARENPLSGFDSASARFDAPKAAEQLSGTSWQDVNGVKIRRKGE